MVNNKLVTGLLLLLAVTAIQAQRLDTSCVSFQSKGFRIPKINIKNKMAYPIWVCVVKNCENDLGEHSQVLPAGRASMNGPETPGKLRIYRWQPQGDDIQKADREIALSVPVRRRVGSNLVCPAGNENLIKEVTIDLDPVSRKIKDLNITINADGSVTQR